MVVNVHHMQITWNSAITRFLCAFISLFSCCVLRFCCTCIENIIICKVLTTKQPIIHWIGISESERQLCDEFDNFISQIYLHDSLFLWRCIHFNASKSSKEKPKDCHWESEEIQNHIKRGAQNNFLPEIEWKRIIVASLSRHSWWQSCYICILKW